MIIVLAIALIFIIIAVIYLFLIMPRVVEAADMDLLSCDYAHRGLWGAAGVPENSLAAFELACRSDYGIELDIQLTKDKKIVVFHDYSLERMCGVKRRVSELTLAELKTLRLAGTNEQIPTFAEVLNLVDGRVPLLVELKGESRDVSLCPRAAKMLDDYRGSFCIESFNPMILSWFKNYRPRYARGQLITDLIKEKRKGNFWLNLALSNLLLNFLSRPDFIAIDKKYQGKLVFKICTGIFRAKAFVWTINSPAEYSVARKGGKHAIFEKIKP